MNKRKIAVIGVTGSIGRQAADILERNKQFYETVLITAHTNQKELEAVKNRLNARHAVMTSPSLEPLMALLRDLDIDTALIGASGTTILPAVFALAEKGVTLALANKECIVASGGLLFAAAKKSGSKIIPVDSEHSAIFQCLQGHRSEDVARLTLTASGGSLRNHTAEQIKTVSVADVLNHPNWNMGKKITVDSATMMNKGLELIEARFLFDMPPEKLAVVIHPQSIVHSIVSYKDGSMLAQMGSPDMRVPIGYALSYPSRLDTGVKPLDFIDPLALTFYKPEPDKYRCLKIAMNVLQTGSQAAMITMNAANETAVEAFLSGSIAFTQIPIIIEEALSSLTFTEPKSVEDVIRMNDIVKKTTADNFKSCI